MFAERSDVGVVPGYSTRAITSDGTLTDSAFQRIASDLLATAVGDAHDVDGIYLSPHGSTASESEHDCEGYLIDETRKIAGSRMPIAVSLRGVPNTSISTRPATAPRGCCCV